MLLSKVLKKKIRKKMRMSSESRSTKPNVMISWKRQYTKSERLSNKVKKCLDSNQDLTSSSGSAVDGKEIMY
jgi:hypothetical protein